MANLPSTTTSSSAAIATQTRKQSRRLIRILKDDHNFDIIEKMINLYDRVLKARIKPAEKYRQEFSILNALLQYAYPKLQAIESDTKIGDNVQFNINIPAPTPKNPDKVKGVTIDTVRSQDGTFQIKGKS